MADVRGTKAHQETGGQAAGAVPPAGAPHEVSAPLQHDAGGIIFADGSRMTPAQRAAENERSLQPLKFQGGQTAGGVAEATQAARAGKIDPFYARLSAANVLADGYSDVLDAPPVPRIRRATRPPVILTDAPDAPGDPALIVQQIDTATGGLVDGTELIDAAEARANAQPAQVIGLPNAATAPSLEPIDLKRMPAASDTDSPSRGQPRIIANPDKKVTGGFSGGADLQYFALDGQELRVLVETLMDTIYQRIQNDLRFSMAITYPQVSARVVIEIQGFASDVAIVIDQILSPEHPARCKNPIAFARTVANEIAFVLVEEAAETDDQGQSLNPPDAIRDQLGLTKPRKQVVGVGAGRSWVDSKT